MNIAFKDTHEFDRETLQRLFLSVDWSSGHYPDHLVRAMRGYGLVLSAWHQERLVGLVAAMDDGCMTAYVHYLLVDPEYQGQGIGHELLERLKLHYRDYLRIVLNAYRDKMGFYVSHGFRASEDETPMFITELWT